MLHVYQELQEAFLKVFSNQGDFYLEPEELTKALKVLVFSTTKKRTRTYLKIVKPT